MRRPQTPCYWGTSALLKKTEDSFTSRFKAYPMGELAHLDLALLRQDELQLLNQGLMIEPLDLNNFFPTKSLNPYSW